MTAEALHPAADRRGRGWPDAGSRVWDVVIAGGGPAGVAAAQALAGSGVRVLLVDVAAPPAHKIGDVLPAAALRLLRTLGLPIPEANLPHTPIRGTLSAWGSDELVATDTLRDPDGPGWRLDRPRFDAALREAAIVSGAVPSRTHVAAVAREGTVWQVTLLTGATVHSHWLIDATGRRGMLARQLGARRLRDAPLVALYALGQSGAVPRLHRSVIEAVSNGWWYAAHLPSGAPVAGFHVGPRDAVRLAGDEVAWRAALAATHHVAAVFPETAYAHGLRPLDASGARLDRFCGDRWLACGDAALAFDPVSGQGIFAALYSGMMAARAIVAALSGEPRAIAEYVERLERLRRSYRAQWQQTYRSETRWPDAPFWAAGIRRP